MTTEHSLPARWATYIARYSKWQSPTYLLSFAISLALFGIYYLGKDGASSILLSAIFFLFLGLLNFERAGFSRLLQSKDEEIAALRGKNGSPA